MIPEYVLDMARQAMQVAMMVGAPVLLMSLIIGLLVVVFQAATQLNEQVLSFILKLLVVAATMVLADPWIVVTTVGYTRGVLTNIPSYVNRRQPTGVATQSTATQFTATQLNDWIAMCQWPLVRVLAFIVIAPSFISTETPTSIKVAFGVVVTVALAPMLLVPAGALVGSHEGL